MKRLDWKSGAFGAAIGVGMILLVGAAERDPDNRRYQISESIVLMGSVPVTYRLDTYTGEVMLLSQDKATPVKGTEISSR